MLFVIPGTMIILSLPTTNPCLYFLDTLRPEKEVERSISIENTCVVGSNMPIMFPSQGKKYIMPFSPRTALLNVNRRESSGMRKLLMSISEKVSPAIGSNTPIRRSEIAGTKYILPFPAKTPPAYFIIAVALMEMVVMACVFTSTTPMFGSQNGIM